MTAGAIPVEVLRIKAQGTDVALPAALTLPDNIGALGDDITDLQLYSMGLVGKRACTDVRFQKHAMRRSYSGVHREPPRPSGPQPAGKRTLGYASRVRHFQHTIRVRNAQVLFRSP
jgi:hypothetical protein